MAAGPSLCECRSHSVCSQIRLGRIRAKRAAVNCAETARVADVSARGPQELPNDHKSETSIAGPWPAD